MDLLDLLGAEYVIDHVISEHNLRFEERAYRSYVSDLLKVIAEGQTAEVQYRYSELIEKSEEKEEKTADEIVMEVITRAGLKGKSNERNGFGGETNA